jgi:hypothetical protein
MDLIDYISTLYLSIYTQIFFIKSIPSTTPIAMLI